MTDLALYTVAVLSIAGLAVLGLHRDRFRQPVRKDAAEAWLPPELWDRACVQPRFGLTPDFVVVDESGVFDREREYFGRWTTPPAIDPDDVDRAHELAVCLAEYYATVRDFADAADVPMVFMDAPAVAQVAEYAHRWVTPAPSVFETHPTAPVVGDVAYGSVPEGCWKTVESGGGYWPCNAAVEDEEVGLCPRHAVELRSAS